MNIIYFSSAIIIMSIIIIITSSYSYLSSPPNSMIIFLYCKLILLPSLSGLLSIYSASMLLKPKFFYLASNSNLRKFTMQHLLTLILL